MEIYLEEGQDLGREQMDKLRQAAEILLRQEGIDSSRAELSLTIVEPEEIRELNREYRGVDKATDVLGLGFPPGLCRLELLQLGLGGFVPFCQAVVPFQVRKVALRSRLRCKLPKIRHKPKPRQMICLLMGLFCAVASSTITIPIPNSGLPMTTW